MNQPFWFLSILCKMIKALWWKKSSKWDKLLYLSHLLLMRFLLRDRCTVKHIFHFSYTLWNSKQNSAAEIIIKIALPDSQDFMFPNWGVLEFFYFKTKSYNFFTSELRFLVGFLCFLWLIKQVLLWKSFALWPKRFTF